MNNPVFAFYYFAVLFSLISMGICVKIQIIFMMKRIWLKCLFCLTTCLACYFWYIIAEILIETAQRIN